jgi:hypothetical protein
MTSAQEAVQLTEKARQSYVEEMLRKANDAVVKAASEMNSNITLLIDREFAREILARTLAKEGYLVFAGLDGDKRVIQINW